MSKYDCTKTVDYAHELKRMCAVDDDGRACLGCPLLGHDCVESKDITEKHITIVQKWSDEHPEKPKLTKKERAFIERLDEGASICGMQDGGLCLKYYPIHCVPIKSDWFAFIDTDDEWNVSDLLKLEVEDE